MSVGPATTNVTPLDGFHVAVVGAGPSGIFVTQELLRSDVGAVTIYDRLPAPYGLLRYGVAPDHHQMKLLTGSFRKVMSDPRVRYVGGVEIGRDLAISALRERFDAVVHAAGASASRGLDVPGEHLPGCFTAEQFVGWYNAHPDHAATDLPHGTTAVVIGGGNVALDVARMLLEDPGELARTDVPDRVLDSLSRRRFTDVHVVVRRSAADATFTTKELRELGELPGVEVRVDPPPCRPAPPSAEPARDRTTRNVDLLAGWAEGTPEPAGQRLHFHFGLSVREIAGTQRIESVRLQPTGASAPTDADLVLPAQLLVAAVGYRGRPVGDLPVDPRSGTVTNVAGRVHRSGSASLGEYVVGWQARGPSGVIGTCKVDARQVTTHLVEDAPALARRRRRDDAAVSTAGDGLDWEHWERVEAAERALGAARGAASVKLSTWDSLRRAAPDRQPPGPS